jgi:hypothetical protein
MDVAMDSQAAWTIKCLAADAADMPLLLLTGILPALVCRAVLGRGPMVTIVVADESSRRRNLRP